MFLFIRRQYIVLKVKTFQRIGEAILLNHYKEGSIEGFLTYSRIGNTHRWKTVHILMNIQQVASNCYNLPLKVSLSKSSVSSAGGVTSLSYEALLDSLAIMLDA